MEESQFKPNAVSYTSVITAWSRSRSRHKETNANSILQRMIASYRTGNISAKPDVVAFTSLINACAGTAGSAMKQKSALKLAIQTFEQMKNSVEFDDPNHRTYTSLFKACSKLASDHAERIRLLQVVFVKCCKEGKLNKDSLNIFLRGVPAKIRAKFLPNGPEDSIPKEWYTNVRRKDRPI